jgi:hypothetical protein
MKRDIAANSIKRRTINGTNGKSIVMWVEMGAGCCYTIIDLDFLEVLIYA